MHSDARPLASKPIWTPAWTVLAQLLLSCVLVPGCQRASISHSATDDFPAAQSELDYFDALEEQQVVSNNDMLHTYLLVVDGEDEFRSYESRLKDAKRRMWLPADFAAPGGESAQVGWICSIGCRVTNFSGGLSYTILGPIPRYATREMVNAQVLVGKREAQGLSGREFVDFLTRLDRIAHFEKLTASADPAKGKPPTDLQGRPSDGKAPPLQPPAARFE